MILHYTKIEIIILPSKMVKVDVLIMKNFSFFIGIFLDTLIVIQMFFTDTCIIDPYLIKATTDECPAFIFSRQ